MPIEDIFSKRRSELRAAEYSAQLRVDMLIRSLNLDPSTFRELDNAISDLLIAATRSRLAHAVSDI